MNRRLPAMLLPMVFGLLVIGCGSISGQGNNGENYSSNGQRIYFTATNTSGQAISYQGGPTGGMGGMGGGMKLYCASCHGPEGHGGQITMAGQTFDVANISWPMLTGQVPEDNMDHPPYTVETLKQAITQGVDPAGKPLKPQMPRWSISGRDLDDLANFIQTLK